MIGLLPLIVRSLTRRRLRTGITVLGIAVAMAALFYLLAFERGYRYAFQGELDRLGAHVLVVPKGCPYDAASLALHGATWPCYLPEEFLGTVRRTPHVAAAAPVLMTALYNETVSDPTVYCGVDTEMRQIKRTWRIQGTFPVRSGDLLAGAEAAKRNGWRVGQTVDLPGLPGQRGRVSGILASVQGAEDAFVYLRMDDAQRLFRHPELITHILVRLDAPEALDATVAALRGCDAGLEMNVVPLAHLFHTIQNLIQSTRVLLGSAVLVALVAAGAGVSNVLLMAVTERTREIGVLRAMGATYGEIFALIWGETLLLCGMGGALGMGIALGGARGVEIWLRAQLPYAPAGTLVRPEMGVFGLCLLACVALGMLAGFLPALRAARLSPAEAIRTTGGA